MRSCGLNNRLWQSGFLPLLKIRTSPQVETGDGDRGMPFALLVVNIKYTKNAIVGEKKNYCKYMCIDAVVCDGMHNSVHSAYRI